VRRLKLAFNPSPIGGLCPPRGSVVPWELPTGRASTLTTWGVCELGVVLIEDHRDEPRWGRPGQEPKSFRVSRSSRYAKVDPAWLPAKTMTPIEAAIHAEDVEQFLLDPDTMMPLRLFGRTVPIDVKVKGVKRTPQQRAAKARKDAKKAERSAQWAKRALETASPKFGRWGRPLDQAG
jgi:hypothetical protein